MRIRRLISKLLRGSKFPAAAVTVSLALVALALAGSVLFRLVPAGERVLALLALIFAAAALAAVTGLVLWFGRDTLHLVRHNKLRLGRLDAFETRLSDIEGQVEASAAQLAESQEAQLRLWRASTEETLREFAKLDEAVAAASERTQSEWDARSAAMADQHRSDLSNLYVQLEALDNLRADLQADRALPALRGWALSPDIAQHVVTLVLERSPALVVELGSGSSTALIGLALKRRGIGRLITVEHDLAFAEKTNELIRRWELDDFVTIVHATLEPFSLDGAQHLWYSRDWLSALGGTIDLLIVDGPPAMSSDRAREPAMHVLYEHLSPEATVLLDDTNRADETEIVAAWTARWPQLTLQMLPFEKGAAELRLGGTP